MFPLRYIIFLFLFPFFVVGLKAQPQKWKGKSIPNFISEFHYINNQLVSDPNSNWMCQYYANGVLKSKIKLDGDSNWIDSTLFYPSGQTNYIVQRDYNSLQRQYYYPNGVLRRKEIRDKYSGELQSFEEYTNTELLLNVNNQLICSYDNQDNLIKSVSNHGYYDLVKEYHYNDQGRLVKIYSFRIAHFPQEILYIVNVDSSDVVNGRFNPFLNQQERLQQFDLSFIQVDRADTGILDMRPPLKREVLRYQFNLSEYVNEKEDAFLLKNGAIQKEKRTLTSFSDEGLPLTGVIANDTAWVFFKNQFLFNDQGFLVSKETTTKVEYGEKWIHQYQKDKLRKIVAIRPDSSVIWVENVMELEDVNEVVYNHYEPYQNLKYTKVVKYLGGEEYRVTYFDNRGKQLESIQEPILDSAKIVLLGDEIQIDSSQYSTERIEYHRKDTVLTIRFKGNKKTEVNHKVYGQYGQLMQNITLFSDGSVKGFQFDTMIYAGKMMKRVKIEEGNETFCQKYIYGKTGDLIAVYTYPEGEKVRLGIEQYFYSENGDTTSIVSKTANGVSRVNFFYEYENQRKRRLSWGKTLTTSNRTDTLLHVLNQYLPQQKRQIIRKGKPLFQLRIDTIQRAWDENGVLRHEKETTAEGKTLYDLKYHANGRPEKTVDNYGYEIYHFENGTIKGHGRNGAFTELFDQSGRLLYQRRRKNDIIYYRYDYRSKLINGYDVFMLTDSVLIESEEDFLEKSFTFLPDKLGENYITTYLGENEFLLENRVDQSSFIFKAEATAKYPMHFALFKSIQSIRYEEQRDVRKNWNIREVLGNSSQQEHYVRNIKYH